jgi:phosphatidylinositol kinase/protein kinase (PI-3  family)
MVTKDGLMFHIDFGNYLKTKKILCDHLLGYFLGNFMKFGMYKRETAPFVLTPEMVFVIGGEKSKNFQEFSNVSSVAFNLLRKHSHLFMVLFALVKKLNKNN